MWADEICWLVSDPYSTTWTSHEILYKLLSLCESLSSKVNLEVKLTAAIYLQACCRDFNILIHEMGVVHNKPSINQAFIVACYCEKDQM